MMRVNITERSSIAVEQDLTRQLERPSLVETIESLLDRAGDLANGRVCVGVSLGDLPPPSVPDGGQRVFWSRPSEAHWWLGLGESWQAESHGGSHLSDAEASATQLWDELDTRLCPVPVRLSVWSESGFTRLLLPLVQFVGTKNNVTVLVAPDASGVWKSLLAQGLSLFEAGTSGDLPDLGECQESVGQDEWLEVAEKAIADIQQGVMDKVVLSRKVEYSLEQTFAAQPVMASLQRRYPSCTVFLTDVSENSWLGASPEKLLDCKAGRVVSEAVAGTVRDDCNELVGWELGEWLLNDPKSRREHRWVVEGLQNTLRQFCQQVDMNSEPSLLRLRGLQHLYQPIRGQLKNQVHFLQLAQHLHPSAAVCGWPQQTAKQWLAQHEPINRQGYSGLVGWLDNQTNAALNVVLRSYRISDNHVDMYAGAGLVAESDPEAEWQETQLKLANMIDAFQDV